MTRYELLDRIGVGGMAEIFRGKAVAAGGFEKPVAIKRILPHLSQDPRFVELLIAEAKVLSLLKHRNIVQIFDVGLGDDNKYFLVMEYVDGKDLGAIQRGLESRRSRMAFDLALHVVAEICEALEHAHTARAPDGKPMALVHRDISPSNVLLSRAGEVKLTDFGIAKRAEQEQTGTGGVRGKFAYISPEQARNEHISPRSDVFAVGILLWELLANRRLFSGLGDLEALRAVREPNVQPPSELDPRIRTEADAIVMGALQRDPQRRPTAGQLGHQLRSLRYSLDDTSGDPATELAKVIDNAEQVERQSRNLATPAAAAAIARSSGFDSGEPAEMTVIRIRTADAFSERNERSISMARSVIDRFEEEETRMAQLSGEQMKQLRGGRAPGDSIDPPDDPEGDSAEMSSVTPPRRDAGAKPASRPRPRRNTDEPTLFRALGPLGPLGRSDKQDDGDGDGPTVDRLERDAPNARYDPDEATRLVAAAPVRDRRNSTPVPERSGGRGNSPSAQQGRQPSRSQPQPPPPAPPPMPRPPPPSQTRRQPDPPMQPSPNPMPVGQTLAPPPAPQPHPGFMTTQAPAAPAYAYPAPPPVYQPPPPPYYPAPPPAPTGYPMYNPPGIASERQTRAATPTAPDAYERPVYPPRPTDPPVSGFQTSRGAPSPLRPWMLVVGALIMAGLAFALTRAFIH